MAMAYYFLDEQLYFPPVRDADEYGIVAIGGDLSRDRLLLAYQSGIFPWFSESEPILWWSPDPRFVLYPDALKISKSMKQILRRGQFEVTMDTQFTKVIECCQSTPRPGQSGTWITEDMQEAYIELHQAGFAHSVEVWEAGQLVGGLYGVSLGSCFFGESMFSHVSNASKTGFISLVQKLREHHYSLIDCQVHTQHLESLGAQLIPREQFMQELKQALKQKTQQGAWTDWF